MIIFYELVAQRSLKFARTRRELKKSTSITVGSAENENKVYGICKEYSTYFPTIILPLTSKSLSKRTLYNTFMQSLVDILNHKTKE